MPRVKNFFRKNGCTGHLYYNDASVASHSCTVKHMAASILHNPMPQYSLP